MPLNGVHAYTDPLSVAAGEMIHFHVSSTHSYEFQVCRLGTDVETPNQDEVLRSWKIEAPVAQAIHPGSYIDAGAGLTADEATPALTLECWVRLWNLSCYQGVITQFDEAEPGGFGLVVEADRAVAFYTGASGTIAKKAFRTAPDALTSPGEKDLDLMTIPLAQWHHLVATVDGTKIEIYIDAARAGRWEAGEPLNTGGAPLRVGAFGTAGKADGLLDADLAMPTIYGRALSEDEIKEQFSSQALRLPAPEELLACWPLNEESGAHVADISGHERHGQIVNHATWMIGGPGFDADVPWYGTYDPNEDPTRGHGLRLASDDLYDCRWSPTFEYRMPVDARSGAYTGRFRFEVDGEERMYDTLFIVRKATTAAKAPIAFLFSTNTWKAYSATPFCPSWPGIKMNIRGFGYAVDWDDPKAPYCCYRHHRAGQPALQVGMRMPWPMAGPYTLEQKMAADFSQLSRADRFTAAWLEQQGFDYDAYAELDLHQDPNLLDDYEVVFVVGHSEYWSLEQYAHVNRFLDSGGNLVSLSGNSLYWRVSFDEAAEVMECRKVDGWGAQLRPEQRGECWHSHDGKRGGAARDCGLPAWELLGVEFLSYNTMGIAGAGPFRVTNADHFLFQKPNRLNMKNGDHFGFDATNPRRQALGEEGDVRVSTLMKLSAGSVKPPGAPAGLTDPDGIEVLAEGILNWEEFDGKGKYFDYYHRELPPQQRHAHDVACEMIYWERSGGGRVFNASSIAAGWPLAVDPQWSGLLKNVLDHFGVSPRSD